MCNMNRENLEQEFFDEDLLELYKKFKEGDENEAGEKLDDDLVKVEFVNYITENISKIVDNDDDSREKEK